jgi:hypothetical protein
LNLKQSLLFPVIARLDPQFIFSQKACCENRWMPGSSPGMTPDVPPDL